jgi:L-threonylcarbamoyladenylate synthase
MDPKIISIIQAGGIIAYPTEAVYGLGCDPFNDQAIKRLLALKQRSISKGLIVIGSDWQQLHHLTAPIPAERLQTILATWPGSTTWVFPKAASVSKLVSGDHATVALRVTDHPIAQALCAALHAPLISTSANIAGHTPARSASEVRNQFGDQLDFIVEGAVGGLAAPTQIRDALSGQLLRGAR